MMRKVKQKISFLLVLVLLVNLLLPCVGALAAESSNDFVVPGGNEQNLISPESLDVSNWGNQTNTTQSNTNPAIETNNNTEKAIASQILNSVNNQQLESNREGQIVPIIAQWVQTFIQRITPWLQRLGITLYYDIHFFEQAVARNISPLTAAKVLTLGTKYYDTTEKSRVLYYKGVAIIITNKNTLKTIYQGAVKSRWVKQKWSW